MNGQQPGYFGEPTKLHCPQCGQPMLIAPQHLDTVVACPRCQHPIEPRRILEALPPAAQARNAAPTFGRTSGAYSYRNRWVAGVLAILLGTFGVHRFYLGYIGIGLLQAGLTVCSFFFLSPVVAIWTFIEGILCFCGAMNDSDGLPLQG